MAATRLPKGRLRIGFSAVAGATPVAVINAVTGKRLAIEGGWLRAIGTSGALRMVDSDNNTQPELMQSDVTIPDGSAGVYIEFDIEANYRSPSGKGISFTRSASMALEGELIYRETTGG